MQRETEGKTACRDRLARKQEERAGETIFSGFNMTHHTENRLDSLIKAEEYILGLFRPCSILGYYMVIVTQGEN